MLDKAYCITGNLGSYQYILYVELRSASESSLRLVPSGSARWVETQALESIEWSVSFQLSHLLAV